MSKVIDSFLVSLGFDLDEQSEKEGTAAMDRMRGVALKMGAALTGAFAAGTIVAKRTAADIETIANKASLLTNVSTGYLDQLGHAIDLAGGSAEEAVPLLETLEQILFNYKQLGEVGPFEDLEKIGIPSSFLIDSKNSVEFLERLVQLIPQLEQSKRGPAIDALGLSEGAELLIRSGPERYSEYINQAKELAQISDDLTQTSIELSQAFSNAGRAFNDLSRDFTEAVGPTITSGLKEWTELLQRVGDGIDYLGEAGGGNKNAVESGGFLLKQLIKGNAQTIFDRPELKSIPNIGPIFRFIQSKDDPVNTIETTQRVQRETIPLQSSVLNNTSTATHQTTNHNKFEFSITETQSAEQTSREVIKEMHRVFDFTEQSLRTATAGK